MMTTGAATMTTPGTKPGTTETASPPQDARPARSGVSVRTRIAATVALLVTVTLAGAGLIVYVIEVERIEEDTIREVQQELDEFVKLEEDQCLGDELDGAGDDQLVGGLDGLS
jgi:two-component system OmpR family sensor kinase